MSTPLTIVALSGKSGTASVTNAAGPTASGETDDLSSTAGFADLLAMLMDLIAAKAGVPDTSGSAAASPATGLADAAAAFIAAATGPEARANAAADSDAGQADALSLDLGNPDELKALFAALLAALGKAGAPPVEDKDTAPVESTDETGETSEAAPDTPDPLAAVLDLLIAALEDAASDKPGSASSLAGLALDKPSGDTLKALNQLLAALTPPPAADGPARTAAPLSAEILDKLKTLDQLLTSLLPDGQAADPQLEDLKTRVAALLGTGSADGAKPATDAANASAAALLGQTGSDKPAAPSGRDIATHLLDGTRPTLQTGNAGSDGDTGNSASQQGQAQSQTTQTAAAVRRATSDADFAARLGAEIAASDQSADAGPDLQTNPAAQPIERAQAAALRAIPSAYAQSASRVDIPQVAFEIARHAANGINHFQIRLDPPDMGRIDVRLELDNAGGLSARLIVDRPETLDLLQRDARGLERALAQTGLDQNKTSLEFSLRQNPFARQDFNQGQGQRQDTPAWLVEAENAAAASATEVSPPVVLYRGSLRPGAVNLVA